MTVDVDEIKGANPIEEVMNEDEPLEHRTGRYVRGVRHDSLVVDVRNQTYYWNANNEWGDVIEWVQRHRKCDFTEACRLLARRAGLPEPVWHNEDGQQALAARTRSDVLTVACRWWVTRIWISESPPPSQSPPPTTSQIPSACPGLTYARWRGWTDETIKAAGLGYTDGDIKGLRGELQMHGLDVDSPAAKAVLMAPAGHLVYPCQRGGRVVYFATRSASRETKAHWNPPSDLVGERQPLFNAAWSPFEDVIVVVEGQADAVTLAQWGVAAVALSGTSANDLLLRVLSKHAVRVVALDADAAGGTARGALSDALGPLTRVLRWPEPWKDANEWLQKDPTLALPSEGEGTSGEGAIARLIDEAPTWAEVVAGQAGEAEGLERERALKQAFSLFTRMPDFDCAMRREELAKAAHLTLRQFNVLLKTARGERAEDNGDGTPAIEMDIPGGLVAEHLVETVAIPPENMSGLTGQGWTTKFAVRYPDGRIAVVNYLDWEGVRYRPVSSLNRVLTERVVRFASGLGERMSLRDLVRMVQATIRKYVDVDVFYETLAAYYVLFTWLYDAFNTVAYLRLLGDTGTGKSRFLQVVGALCFRSTSVSGAATTSPIFRILDRYRGTLIMDEADYRASDEKADIIKILNTGYQREQGVVLRSGDKNVGFETEVYVVYGPKVIATRKRFYDKALESRCITYETGGPTTRLDIPVEMPNDWAAEATDLRNRLLRYRMEYWRPNIELNYAAVEVSAPPRLRQVTVALQTIIDDPDLQRDLRTFVEEYNRQSIVESGMTVEAKVLEAVCGVWFMDLYDNHVPDMRMKRLAQAVNLLIDEENEGDGSASGGAAGDASGDAEGGQQEGGKPAWGRSQDTMRKVTPKRVGQVVRTVLHLRTERDSNAGRRYIVMYDHERVTALRERFGVTEDWLNDVIATLRKGGMAVGAVKAVAAEQTVLRLNEE